MILLAVTREPFPLDRFPGAAVETLVAGPWRVTAVVERGAAACRSDEHVLEVVETPVLRDGRSSGPTLLRLEFDARKGRLVALCPPDSARPLYFTQGPGGAFLCATRVSALGRAGTPLEADRDALPEVLVYRFVTAPRTLYRGVQVLPAGAGLSLHLGEGPKIEPYTPPATGGDRTEEALAEGVRERLDGAVANLEPCADSLVVLLSGGLDSSILYSLCRERFRTPDSYSMSNTFGGEDDLEKPYALSAAAALGSTHSWWSMDEGGYRSRFLRAIARAEEPLHHIQSVLIGEVVERARPEGGGVVLCGEGADGAFGLEIQRLLHRAASRRYRVLARPPLRQALGAAVRMAGRDRTFVEFLGEAWRGSLPLDDPRHLLWSFGAYGSRGWVCDHLDVEPSGVFSGRKQAVAHVRDRSLLDIVTLLGNAGDVAVTQAVWGKLAESTGNRMVFPFSAREFTDYAFSIPWADKLETPKHLLRLAARRLGVPEFIITRAKAGFGVHEKHWARPGGAFDPFIPLAAKVFDEAWLRGLQTGTSEHAMTFWSLVNYAVWKRLVIEGEPLADLEAELRESEARATAAP